MQAMHLVLGLVCVANLVASCSGIRQGTQVFLIQNEDLIVSFTRCPDSKDSVVVQITNHSTKKILVSNFWMVHIAQGKVVASIGRRCGVGRGCLPVRTGDRFICIEPGQSSCRTRELYGATANWFRVYMVLTDCPLIAHVDSIRISTQPENRWDGYEKSCISYIVLDSEESLETNSTYQEIFDLEVCSDVIGPRVIKYYYMKEGIMKDMERTIRWE